MKTKTFKSCYYCGIEFGINATTTVVRVATKPTGTPHRYVQVGSCCDVCEYERKLTIDNWRV